MEVTLEQMHLASHIAIRHLQPETVDVHCPFKIHLKIRVTNITWGSQSNCMQCSSLVQSAVSNVELVSSVLKSMYASIIRGLMMEAVSECWTRNPAYMADCLRGLPSHSNTVEHQLTYSLLLWPYRQLSLMCLTLNSSRHFHKSLTDPNTVPP
jgi:hypothetical protein